MKLKKLFGAIQKVNDQDDGTIIVEGIASTEEQDDDGETILANAIKTAIPDYMKFGAVREMHKPQAAGTALDISVGDDGVTVIKAHIVDAEAIKKVKTNVYKGFSIGGSVTERDTVNKTIITGINLVEVSLVDRPANPSAVITCYKADGIDPADLEDNPEKLEKAAGTDDLNKSMYQIKDFSTILRDLSYLIQDAQWESECYADNSNIPVQLVEWLKSGVSIFNQFSEQESAKLVTSVENIVKAKQLGGSDVLAKAGTKFSKATKEQLADIHKTLKECDGKLAALGYDAAADDDAAEDATTKAADSEALQKVRSEHDLTKADLTKVQGERDALAKRVKELEAQPEDPKGAVMDLTKSADMKQQEFNVQPVVDATGEVHEAASLIKAIHAAPLKLA
ncbi:HK97 family phage prohead protease [Alkanindiges illinoisensis]|uniref:hypothetical protein n=1 Tax=Alkanindiges illinoisensis TaxID=197183 RepID=UPI0006881738|nr:hypothetical protein [Alkanindiges illinoisensis]